MNGKIVKTISINKKLNEGTNFTINFDFDYVILNTYIDYRDTSVASDGIVNLPLTKGENKIYIDTSITSPLVINITDTNVTINDVKPNGFDEIILFFSFYKY